MGHSSTPSLVNESGLLTLNRCRMLLLLLFTVVVILLFWLGYWALLDYSGERKRIERNFVEISRQVVPKISRHLLYGENQKISTLLGRMIQNKNLLFAEIRHDRKKSLAQKNHADNQSVIVRVFTLDHYQKSNLSKFPAILYVGTSSKGFDQLLGYTIQRWLSSSQGVLSLSLMVVCVLVCRRNRRSNLQDR